MNNKSHNFHCANVSRNVLERIFEMVPIDPMFYFQRHVMNDVSKVVLVVQTGKKQGHVI